MPIRSHIVTLWLDGQLWESAFLCDPGGEISIYAGSRFPIHTSFTRETLPAGVKVCPNLTLGHAWAPLRTQREARKCALRYGYELFEIDILPW